MCCAARSTTHVLVGNADMQPRMLPDTQACGTAASEALCGGTHHGTAGGSAYEGAKLEHAAWPWLFVGDEKGA